MRLLQVPRQSRGGELPRLVEFLPDKIPPYAVLSHRWNPSPSEEISFADLTKPDSATSSSLEEKQGYQKLQSSCTQARNHGLDYIWIDTCCIDKSSSAELSEAINSMYAWYNRAQICFGYLADVPSSVDPSSYDSELSRTEWATRGWTLQELLAPPTMVFYSSDWHEIGTRESLSSVLSVMTGIDEKYLMGGKPQRFLSASIAKRMSWAARRKTSRPEDIAYCLMGLFQVNMPMLYGEGENAFIRLQEEIMKHSDDHSLFAWTEQGQDASTGYGLLAKHPRCFRNSGSIIPYEDREVRAPFLMSNRGLRIELYLTKLATESLYAAALDCPVPPDYEDSSFLAIYLRKLPFSHGQYARVKVGSFVQARERGNLQTIYVRQSIVVPDIEGLFPTHVFQLRKFVIQDGGYRVAKTIRRDAPKSLEDIPRVLQTTQSIKDQMPAHQPVTCKITSKRDKRPLFAIHLVFEEMESVIILLGTANLQVGFSVVLKESPELSAEERLDLFRGNFEPFLPDSTAIIGYHQIRVSAEPVVSRDEKYYMIDMQIDALERPRNLVEAALNAFEDLVTPESYLPIQNRRTVMERLKRPFGLRRNS